MRTRKATGHTALEQDESIFKTIAGGEWKQIAGVLQATGIVSLLWNALRVNEWLEMRRWRWHGGSASPPMHRLSRQKPHQTPNFCFPRPSSPVGFPSPCPSPSLLTPPRLSLGGLALCQVAPPLRFLVYTVGRRVRQVQYPATSSADLMPQVELGGARQLPAEEGNIPKQTDTSREQETAVKVTASKTNFGAKSDQAWRCRRWIAAPAVAIAREDEWTSRNPRAAWPDGHKLRRTSRPHTVSWPLPGDRPLGPGIISSTPMEQRGRWGGLTASTELLRPWGRQGSCPPPTPPPAHHLATCGTFRRGAGSQSPPARGWSADAASASPLGGGWKARGSFHRAMHATRASPFEPQGISPSPFQPPPPPRPNGLNPSAPPFECSCLPCDF